MDKKNKKAIRAAFREAVFTRDKYRCRCCGIAGKDRQGGDGWKKLHKDAEEKRLADLDAHHIIKREWMPNGGYVADNGIAVCDLCHIKAEMFWDRHKTGMVETPIGFLPYDLFKLVGSNVSKAMIASRKLGDDDEEE